MPHIHVKIVGKSEAEKTTLAQELTKAVVNTVGAKEGNISVSIEDVEMDDWVEKGISRIHLAIGSSYTKSLNVIPLERSKYLYEAIYMLYREP